MKYERTLAYKCPELIKEWHPTLNGDKTPENVSFGSGYRAWWILEYNDPKTNKTFVFEWQREVYHRSKGDGCPFLTGKRVYPGFNDLATKCPELVKEWHPTLNGDKTPESVSFGSGYMAWWILEYNDPKTNKIFVFEWPAAVYHRSKGEGCPFLTGKKVYPGFNDLSTICPEIGKQVHPTKNGNRTALDIVAYSNKKIWWIYPYDDPDTGKHFDFEWDASPASRIDSKGCPFLSNQRLWIGFNDLKTKYPRIASEWNYELNKKKPEDYMPNSRDKVWWIYPYDDPITGKHFDFIWQARITHRVQDDSNCPFLSNQAVFKGFNDLATKRPDLAEEWDFEKNKITPDAVTLYSNKKRWWKCQKCGKSWYAAPSKRAYGQGCRCLQTK